MAVPLSATDFFESKKVDFEIELATFSVFLPPGNFKLIEKHLKGNSTYLGRFKFEHSITDRLDKKDKGIYMFVLEDLNSFGPQFSYLLYVGRAQKTNSFRQRFYTYRGYIGSHEAPENYKFMTNFWSENTYIHFFKIEDDDKIVEIEKEIVRNLRPPLNSDYFVSKREAPTSLYDIN